ncbi:extracellular solute-binding protein [Paenibacillus gansuensis]|uniref:Extracellular solute-binding protein n=1 Tax=Paenibacillus gansuensis TaxID=306542 RepID=A0ABW5P8K9_9BACL
MAWRKSLTAMLALLLFVSVLAACSGSNSNSGSGGNKEAQAEEGANNKPEEAPELPKGFTDGKYDPPVTITTISSRPSLTFRDGESIEDNVHTRWAKETLGINLKYLWSVPNGDDAKTKLSLSLSANEPLPDVLMMDDKAFESQLIESGRFMDLTEAFEKYASEDVKKLYESTPGVWNRYTRDGKIYGIPHLSVAMQNDPILWIRQDWMDKLGLQAPKTLDDVENIMDAFVTKDPDGNGKKDTFGLAMSQYFKDWISDTSWVFGAYGTVPKIWTKGSDGKLEYGSIQPGAKEALARMNQWFKKGYISKEFGAMDGGKASELILNGKAGIIGGAYWLANWPLPDAIKNNPGAVFKPYPIPVGPDGKAGRQGQTIAGGGLMVNKDFKHVDALFLYLNKLFEGADPKPGSAFEHGFAEGYDYVMKDGKASGLTEDIPGGKLEVFQYFLTTQRPNVPMLEMETFDKLAKGGKPETPFELIASQQLPGRIEGGAVVYSQKEASKQDLFEGPATPAMQLKGEILNTMEADTYIKMIYGETPLDAFDKFVSDWKSKGGDEITKEVNEWYQSVSQ